MRTYGRNQRVHAPPVSSASTIDPLCGNSIASPSATPGVKQPGRSPDFSLGPSPQEKLFSHDLGSSSSLVKPQPRPFPWAAKVKPSKLAAKAADPSANKPGGVKGEERVKAKKQLHLDFGQKAFTVTTCKACGMSYAPGVPDDEKSHNRFCKSKHSEFSFPGWKEERCVARHGADRVIEVRTSDATSHVSKAMKVQQAVMEALGMYEGTEHPGKRYYLYISQREVVGFCLVEPITVAFPVKAEREEAAPPSTPLSPTPSTTTPLPEASHAVAGGIAEEAKKEGHCGTDSNDTAAAHADTPRKRLKIQHFFRPIAAAAPAKVESSVPPPQPRPSLPSRSPLQRCSDAAGAANREHSTLAVENTPRPAVLGINQIFVRENHRRKGIASRLLDAARTTAVYGTVIAKEQMAFSCPTAQGSSLAQSYFINPQYLVYFPPNPADKGLGKRP